MPPSSLHTRPVPVPVRTTVSVYWLSVKVAVTLAAAVIGTTHAPVPVQAPLQLVKLEPVAGVAVSVTLVPCA